MKRTPFKRKPTTPLKRTPLRKVSKQKLPTLKRKLWQVFSIYIKKRDKNICFTCGRKSEGMGLHSGHFVPKSVGGLSLYFHEDNVHAQCYNCNINLGGNTYVYGKKLGEKAEKLYALKGKIEKWSVEDYLKKIEFYRNKQHDLE